MLPRRLVLGLALLLVAPTGPAALLPPVPPADLEHALALGGLARPAPPPLGGSAAESILYGWAEQDRLAGHAVAAPELPPIPLPAEGPLTAAVVFAYAVYGLDLPTPEELAAMRAQEHALDPAFGSAIAGLTAALAAYQLVVPGLSEQLVDGQPHGAMPDPRPPDAALAVLRGEGLRMARAIDAVRAAGATARPTFTADSLLVFHDPRQLVMVGGGGDNTYDGNRLHSPLIDRRANMLTVDEGGDDTYRNNAGGAYPTTPCFSYAFTLFRTGPQFELPDPTRPDLGMCGNGLAAAASIDFGGDDAYISDVEALDGEHQVVQGSSMFGGLGFLVDESGNDTYEATLVERGVAYQAVQGSSGAIAFYGSGLFLDGAGSDTYSAFEFTTAHNATSQQRAQGGGETVFFDLGPGDDAFLAVQQGPAIAWQGAQGFVATFVDEAGNDTFTVLQSGGTGSQQLAHGDDGPMLVLHGNDRYTAHQVCDGLCGWQDVQGAAEAGGAGQLVDEEGDDAYEAITGATGTQGAQGGAILAPAMLIDDGGNDSYLASASAVYQYVQGGGGGGFTLLYDGAGDDRYLAMNGNPGALPGNQYAQGGSAGLYALLLDRSGDDAYAATFDPTGGSLQHVRGYGERAGTGLFFDGAGRDAYEGVGADDTAWVQGTGVGLDQRSG